MKLVTIPVGAFETNCYLMQPSRSRTLYIIDPGGDAADILHEAKKFDCDRTAILLTHAHVDHISALGELCRERKVEFVFLREPDLSLYRSPANALPPWFPAAKDLPETVGSVTNAEFQTLPLPGHTPGGSGFLFAETPPVLFAGDTIFAGSVGRTDLPGGNGETLLESIHSQILPLPDEVVIYSGHGPATSVKRERQTNPYLRNF